MKIIEDDSSYSELLNKDFPKEKQNKLEELLEKEIKLTKLKTDLTNLKKHLEKDQNLEKNQNLEEIKNLEQIIKQLEEEEVQESEELQKLKVERSIIIKNHMRERGYLKLFLGKEYFIGFSNFINFLYMTGNNDFLEYFYEYIICISNLAVDFLSERNKKCGTLIYSDQYEDKTLGGKLFCDVNDILPNSPYDKSIYQEINSYNNKLYKKIEKEEKEKEKKEEKEKEKKEEKEEKKEKEDVQIEAYFVNFGAEFDKMNTNPNEPDNSLGANVPNFLTKENIAFLDKIDTLMIGYDPKINAPKAQLIANIILYKISEDQDFDVFVLGIDKSGATGNLLRDVSTQHIKSRGIGAGSIARWILEIANVPIIMEYLGKPSEHITRYMDKLLNSSAIPTGSFEEKKESDASSTGSSNEKKYPKCLMIGDTLDTDIIFGNEIGVHTMLVLSGSTNHSHLQLSDFLHNKGNKIKYSEITEYKTKLESKSELELELYKKIPKSIKKIFEETDKKIFEKKIEQLQQFIIKDEHKPTYIKESLKQLLDVIPKK